MLSQCGFTIGSGITKDHERIVLLAETGMLGGICARRRHRGCSSNTQDEMAAGNDVQGGVKITCDNEILMLLTLSGWVS